MEPTSAQESGKRVRWEAPTGHAQHEAEVVLEHRQQKTRNKKDNQKQSTSFSIDHGSPWSLINVLTFDGGGARGYSALLILHRLMDSIQELERQIDPRIESSAQGASVPGAMRDANDGLLHSRYSSFRPCHYFDVIGGTSTGGLIAIMLGRLRMSVDECIEAYENLGALAHSKNRDFRDILAEVDPRFVNETFASDPARCKTLVLSYSQPRVSHGTGRPYLFRSYDHRSSRMSPLERNPGLAHELPIWQVARATSAAALFFDDVEIEGQRYRDGAVWANNPSCEILWEVLFMYRSETDAKDTNQRRSVNLRSKLVDSYTGGVDSVVNFFLSIGSGRTESVKSSRRTSVLRSLRSYFPSTSNSEDVHEKMTEEAPNVYRRLNVHSGLNRIQSYRWEAKGSKSNTFQRIKAATLRYLGTDEVRYVIQDCAKRLVDCRHKRANTVRWEFFALGIRYRCPYCQSPLLMDRNELMFHLQTKHEVSSPEAPEAPHDSETMTLLLEKGRVNSDIITSICSTTEKAR